MYLITGITGNVGGAAARTLLAAGKSVRALVRDPNKAAHWSQQGVDIRKGDWTDSASIIDALQGVEGAYIMLPPIWAPEPGFPEAKAVIASLKQAFDKFLAPRVVALSSIGSEKDHGLGLITQTHLLEEALKDLKCPVAFVRAGSFFENFAHALKSAPATGTLDIFYSPVERKVPMIATADIGREVAELLMKGWTGKKIIELGSQISPNDLADALTQVIGKPIKARAVPRDQWTQTLEIIGMPKGKSGPYEEMTDSFNKGWITFGVPGTERVEGKITPFEFFQQRNLP